MTNLDILRLYPSGTKSDVDGFYNLYLTDDEQYLVMRVPNSPSYWRVMHRQGDSRGPRTVTSIGSAFDEIRERRTGRPYHRHPERVVI